MSMLEQACNDSRDSNYLYNKERNYNSAVRFFSKFGSMLFYTHSRNTLNHSHLKFK